MPSTEPSQPPVKVAGVVWSRGEDSLRSPQSAAQVAEVALPQREAASGGPLEIVRELVIHYAANGRPTAVDYEDCVLYEPINELQANGGGTWQERTWALALFFKGPGGERGGSLFAAVKDLPEEARLLDKVALESLRRAIINRFLDEFPDLTFSVNVAIATIQDDAWFLDFLATLDKDLGSRGAQKRVVVEIPEHSGFLWCS